VLAGRVEEPVHLSVVGHVRLDGDGPGAPCSGQRHDVLGRVPVAEVVDRQIVPRPAEVPRRGGTDPAARARDHRDPSSVLVHRAMLPATLVETVTSGHDEPDMTCSRSVAER
jgi:hypothetical protein